MKKIKKLIYIFLIIIIILIITITVMKLNNKNSNENTTNSEITSEIIPVSVKRTNSESMYFLVNDTIRFFIKEIDAKDTEVVYSLLDESYISENKINNDNIFNIIQQYGNSELYRTVELYDYYEEVFYIKGMLDEKNIFFELRYDEEDSTYTIKPIEEKKFDEDIKNTEEIKTEKIEDKTYNIMTYRTYTDGEVAKSYYNEYLRTTIYNINEAYTLLNEEYRTARFGEINNFNQYINENKENIVSRYKIENIDKFEFNNREEKNNFIIENDKLLIKSYSRKVYDEYVQYVCRDSNSNYYIFNVKNPGEYNVVLDSHSIDLPEFIERYNSSNEQTKVGMNIEKVFDALNDKDYKYVYNKLADSFKNNYFKTQEEFENYIKQQIYEKNSVEYVTYKKEGNTSIYQIKVKERDNENSEQKNMTIIMKLGEDTDFVMSFSFE